MAKLKNDPIRETDLIDFLTKYSDFAFELRCLELLSSIGFQCKHGGSYTDCVTKKTRQFDIRAQMRNEKLYVRCAVECKNLSESFPLMVMCIPRVSDESFHELVYSYPPDRGAFGLLNPALSETCNAIRINEPDSEYRIGGFVGKSCVQVGKDLNESITSNDAEVYEKWSQALSSANDLANDAANSGEEKKDRFLSLVLPVLVVPDGTLWKADYQMNGKRINDPVQTERCSFFVGQSYNIGLFKTTDLVISHLEFVTLSGLENLMKTILVRDNSWFPLKKVFQ
jgi:hypothetical protein